MLPMKSRIAEFIHRNKTVSGILHNKRRRIVFIAAASLVLNISYAVYNGILGLMYRSVWFLTLCAYYITLAVMRYAAVSCERRNNFKKTASEVFVARFTGVMLMILSLILSGSVYYSIFHEVAKANGTIVMITIATYTFYKVIIAFTNAVKAAKHRAPLLIAIRNIACADASASILSLQRSMLISFDGMSPSEIKLMDTATGIAVCLFVLILGFMMTIGILGGKRNGKIKNRESK